MNIFYKVEEFMLNLFPNKFAKSNVFALLYGVKTWRSSTRKLADVLRMPESSLRVVLGELIDEGYIRKIDDGFVCAYTAQDSAHTESSSAQSCATPAQDCATPAPLPPTPPITNNIKKEKENDFVREQSATQNPPEPSFSFENYLSLFRSRNNNEHIKSSDINSAKQAWNELPPWKQKMLLAELRTPNGFCKDNPLWTITDFNPQPYDYNGKPEFYIMVKTGKLWSAKITEDAKPGVYSEEDIDNFGLIKLKHFNP